MRLRQRFFRFTQNQRSHQPNGGQAGRQVERYAVGRHIDCARNHQIISLMCQDWVEEELSPRGLNSKTMATVSVERDDRRIRAE